MIFNFHKNHKELLLTIFLMYGLLSIFIAVLPAFQAEENNGPLPGQKPLSAAEERGLRVYIANGCVACHTQQVRDIEMDKVWGARPSLPGDYYFSKARMGPWRQSPSLLGSERTGPDLTNVGQRLPSDQWQYLHLYNPRALVPGSIMPAFPWLFERKTLADSGDVVISVPDGFRQGKGELVPTQDARDLVAYLLSLTQVPLPQAAHFLPTPKSLMKDRAEPKPGTAPASGAAAVTAANGEALYQSTCAVCHQPGGEGVKGAFPPLKGSEVVNDGDASLHIKIVLGGYDALPGYGVMPPFKDRFSDDEVAAIINYERTHWGNNGPGVTPDEVARIRTAMGKGE